MPPTDAPTQADVRRQLEAFLAYDLFRRSARLQRFLRVIVDWTLAGHADGLTERLLGVEVFERGPAHDPRIDPIVRVEARLRAKLKAYYTRAGRDEILIALRPGSYAPVLCRHASAIVTAFPSLLAGPERSAPADSSGAGFSLRRASVI